jgi:hypothetical protein
MLNGINSNTENFKSLITTDFSSSERFNESYEFQIWGFKELPQGCDDQEPQVSPTFRVRKKFHGFDDAETNFQSRRITEEVKSSVGTSITEFRLATWNSPESNKFLDNAFGNTPCAAYCGCCKKYVHTFIQYQEEKPSSFLQKISEIISFCCGAPNIQGKYILHKCTICNLTLARI